MTLQTEFEFTLPRGYVDGQGRVHQHGRMRLATALDEIAPLRDTRVRANQAYLTILLLARVITRLGEITTITPEIVENLFAADLAYLQVLYRQINEAGSTLVQFRCPECDATIELDLTDLGGSVATP